MEIDPRVRLVSEKQRIDCQVGLDEGEDYGSEMRNSYENNKHVEVSLTIEMINDMLIILHQGFR